MTVRSLSILASALLVCQGCVYTPRVVETYAPECPEPEKKVVVDKDVVQAWPECENVGCLGSALLVGTVSAGTYLVSNTVAVTGNLGYWVGHQLDCN